MKINFALAWDISENLYTNFPYPTSENKGVWQSLIQTQWVVTICDHFVFGMIIAFNHRP
ncbi:MAG: hypothetical protein HYU97_08275 [Deltaproteobacteria bacterium]|nr:hypothetical protein [Deltaproteobacteria bacterium]